MEVLVCIVTFLAVVFAAVYLWYRNRKNVKGSNLENMDPDKRRWIMVGIKLHTIISPALRKFVGKELDNLWDNLKRNKNIDNQQHPNQLKAYQFRSLNYEAINNNKVRSRKISNQYDYCIRNPVDLSKLFLETHIAKYTAFDESCDASALLGIVINTGIFPQKAVDDARKIRQDIRNMWAHCDFREWNEYKYQDCLNLMKQFIINLGLPTCDETEVLTKIEEQNKKGRNFIDGISPEEVTLADIKTQTAILLKHVDRLADIPRDICKLERELTDINSIQTDLTLRLANVEQETKDNTLAIAVHTSAIAVNTSAIAVNTSAIAVNTSVIKVNTDAIDECKKKMEEQESSIPKHMNEKYQIHIDRWKKDEETFSVTRATESVAKLIETNNVVTVVGSSGSGKSFIIHHVALQLESVQKFELIPFVSSPVDIRQYRDMKKNQLFIIDDLCGKNYMNENDVESWKKHIKDISELFPDPSSDHGKLKILVSCRLQISKNEQFKQLDLFSKTAVDLQSEKYYLLPVERSTMIGKYIKNKIPENRWQEINKNLGDCHFFPLLCKLAKGRNIHQLQDLFSSPIHSIRTDIKDMILKNPMENCALVLCVLFPEGFHEDFIDPETRPQTVQQKVTDIIRNFKEVTLDNEREIEKFRKTFEQLDGTYVKKLGPMYTISHDKIYDMVAVEGSHQVTKLFLKYGTSTLIAQLYRLKSIYNVDDNDILIYLNENYQNLYFDRIIQDLKEAKSYQPFFHNQQLREEKYRIKVMEYIQQNKESCDELFRRLDREGMTEEHKEDDFYTRWYGDTYRTTPVIEATKTGFYDLVQYFIQINCDCNKKDSYINSPLFYSCKNGFVKVTDLLMRHGVEYRDGLVWACVLGKIDAVRVIADSGVDLSVCGSVLGWTPLTVACYWGRSEVVKLLLDKGADPLQTDRQGDTALDVARRERRRGDDTIINLLKSHMKQ